MKTSVSPASLDVYFGKVKDIIAPNQKQVIYAAMQPGIAYTRNELGQKCGYSQTSAGRAIKELIDDGSVIETGRKTCPVSKERVGAVMLAIGEGQ